MLNKAAECNRIVCPSSNEKFGSNAKWGFKKIIRNGTVRRRITFLFSYDKDTDNSIFSNIYKAEICYIYISVDIL